MKTNSMNNNTSISTYLFGWLAILLGRFTLEEWAVVVGMLATIFGFLITWYYKHQEFKIKKQALENNKYEHKTKK